MSRLKSFFKPVSKYKYQYWITIFMAVMANMLLNYLSSFMNKNIFNGIEYHSYELFGKGCTFGVILLVIAFFYPFTRYLHIRVVRTIIFDLKTSMVKSLTNFPMRYFDSSHSADAMQKISNDADSLKTSYFTGVYSVVNLVLVGLFSITMMIYLNAILGFISIIIASFTVVLLLFFNKRVKSNYKVINEKLTRLTALFSDILHGMVVIKMCRGSGLIFDRYNLENEEVNHTYQKVKRLDASMEMCNFLVGTISTFGTIIAGVIMAKYKIINYGTVMAMVTFQITLSNVFTRIGRAFSLLMSAISRYERIEKFMECELEGKGGGERVVNRDNKMAVEFSNVSFSYDQDSMVINDLSFQVPHGRKYILAGSSGSGKSTIFKLLLRLYDINKGSIKVFGKNLEQYNLQTIRNNIAFVSQDCYLFNGTVYENITCNEKDVSEMEVERVGEMAGIDQFISLLENGYETEIQNGGSNLSGGQRQRIALARALLRKAPIILLDEVTSALDSENEHHLYKTLDKLPNDVTVIMITHRMDTIKGFDCVLHV